MNDELAELDRAVRAHVRGAEDTTVAVIVAVAGLLAAVAYADRDHSAAEREEIRGQLARIELLSASAIQGILSVLDRHIVALSTKFVPRFTRTLREETERETRLQLLEVLLAVAAADGRISHDEIVSLRNITTALGLSQADYNQIQGRYRALLHFIGEGK